LTAVAVLLVLGAAVLVGLVAYTGNPILVGVAGGVVVGSILLARPVWNIWVVLALGLLVVGVVPIWAEDLGSRASWGVSVLCFLLFLGALYRLLTSPRQTRRSPAFVWVALAFMLYAILNTAIQPSGAYSAFSGFKRYFQATGLLFALAWFEINEQQIRNWQRFFLVVAVLQLPWALYELLRLVPIREGLKHTYPGLVPIDVVAGTFGASLFSGGANAEMATFLIIVLAFLLARRKAKLVSMGVLALAGSAIVVPLFLGETKVVVILLPLMFMALYRRELISRPHYAIVGLSVSALLTVSATLAYLSIGNTTFEEQVRQTLRYNVYERGYGGFALNRTTVLSFWLERQGMHDPVSAIVGNGLGTAHDRTGGKISRRYRGYGVGLTAASTLLWEQGIVGTGLFLLVLALAWRTAGKLQRPEVDAVARADAAAIQAVLPIFAFYLIYRAALLEGLPFQLVFASLLGYLAWLWRRYGDARSSK
jgi:hypothetical protein